MSLDATRIARAASGEPGARFGNGSVEHDATLLHHHHAISDRQRAIDALLGEDDRTPCLLDRREECVGSVGVELGRWLVEQQELGPQRKRRCETDALELTTRKLNGATGGQVGRADLTKRDGDLRPDLVGRHRHVLEPERDLVVDARHHDLVLRVLEDGRDDACELGGAMGTRIQPADLDPPREAPTVKVRHEACESAQERRLAAAGGPEQCNDLAGMELERHVADGRDTTGVREREPFDPD